MAAPPAKDRREELLDQYIAVAKQLHAKTAREAAEMATGRALSDDEWANLRTPWEARWAEWDA